MVDDFIHGRMMELVKLYLIIGGMPAVVQKYLDTKKLNIVSDYQNNIINLYKKDISRYDPGNKLLLDEIFNLIPSELNAKTSVLSSRTSMRTRISSVTRTVFCG